MARSQLPLLAAAVGIGAFVTFLYLNRRANQPPEPLQPREEPTVIVPAGDQPTPPPEPAVIPALQENEADQPQDPLQAFENAGKGQHSADPAQLLERIGEALEKGDFAEAGQLIGSGALTPEASRQLAALVAQGPLKFRRPNAASEVGELELNTRARWALQLDEPKTGRNRIFFDLSKQDGKWMIEKITLPSGTDQEPLKARLVDSLGIADAFLQAALHQQFERAKQFVDVSQVSDAKIAGLCILFEDGGYHLRPKKPLRAMFQRGDTAGYLAHAVADDGTDAAQFSITMRQSASDGGWRLIEINLEQLLADYARRVAGGDVYYTPLLKNPKGGDTLVLYFDFDEDGLTPRTQRQLKIVADLLKLDPGKKLTISGHTDALGTEPYNEKLSAGRATSVKEFLVRSGVIESQIVTVAQGQTHPRRPNFTETGEDNPTGRRANRRTEIYLDF